MSSFSIFDRLLSKTAEFNRLWESGLAMTHRRVEPIGEAYALREASETYARQFAGEIAPLRMESTISWEENAESAEM